MKIEQIEASEAGVKGFLDEIQESLRTKTYTPKRYGASTYRGKWEAAAVVVLARYQGTRLCRAG